MLRANRLPGTASPTWWQICHHVPGTLNLLVNLPACLGSHCASWLPSTASAGLRCKFGPRSFHHGLLRYERHWRVAVSTHVRFGVLAICSIIGCSPGLAADPLIGAWTLNRAKSHYGPGADPRKQETFVCEATKAG